MFAFGVISIEVWPTEMPVWAVVLALLIGYIPFSIWCEYHINPLSIALFYVIPIGMIQAIANQQIGLNVITELIVGYALPGKPIAMMMFKVSSSNMWPLFTSLIGRWSLLDMGIHRKGIFIRELYHSKTSASLCLKPYDLRLISSSDITWKYLRGHCFGAKLSPVW